MFYDDFEINLVWFDVYKDLMHDMCVTGRIHRLILHLVPHPTLYPAPHSVCDPALHLARDPALGVQASWWLVHWRSAMGESETWVLCPLMDSSY
jgi:hypothetical protein